MKVNELINELSGCDPELRVFMDDNEVVAVEQINWTVEEKNGGELRDKVFLEAN
jgi:hypothetical protein